MSHYLMFVTNRDKVKLEKQMEPFWEETENERYAEREYICEKGEYWNYYEREILPGILACLGDDNPMFEDYRKDWEQTKQAFDNAKGDDEKLKELIQKEEGCYCDDNGNLYWLAAKDPKWDWYMVGGRWDGWLSTDKNEKCNEATKREIDFGKVLANEKESFRAYYKRIKAREGKDWTRFLNPPREYKDDVTEDEYIDSLDLDTRPYGYLDNGKWVDRETNSDFEKNFDEWWSKLDPDTLVTLVDCHI